MLMCIVTFCLFLLLYSISLINIPQFIHSFNGHLGCFQLRAIMNGATGNSLEVFDEHRTVFLLAISRGKSAGS